jgi:hypothetical protein
MSTYARCVGMTILSGNGTIFIPSGFGIRVNEEGCDHG